MLKTRDHAINEYPFKSEHKLIMLVLVSLCRKLSQRIGCFSFNIMSDSDRFLMNNEVDIEKTT